MFRSDFLVHTGGILFKVYIVGETVRVVRRFSLPDVNDDDMENNEGIFRFPRVSCATNNAEDADVDPCIAGEASLLVH
jgi:inositol-1,3,4-trisphosphate 5/6-kinase/inositol-tetrakisphosphate 1-kinase